MLPLAGAVTAGGASRRFGSDKAGAVLEGRPLLQHVTASLSGCLLRLLIAPPERYALPGWQNVPDTRPGEGPLAALEAALLAARAQMGEGWVAFAGVDMPRLTPAYWELLAEVKTLEVLAVRALDAAWEPQPLAALYHTALLERVTGLLDGGERRMREAALPEQTALVPFVEVQRVSPSALHNVNTPADLLVLAKPGQ
ncbi:molybdenum cofactor guanylyltransferase [Deinococcus hopiensis]|uniref:Probable molybdenum cofactor guanylyltransferase n=1 Tax=Deinococcus hopiensis KR-140 TaxID=695939 RepID=A0A1W1V9V6_9DEIO|nr:molybdenum cofactor guanylyltransferase [Deinococcus hopiensis]SMB89784.1 molybdenum cofactor guanylyltransferase [Deinococcus hopiensis KR-140]